MNQKETLFGESNHIIVTSDGGARGNPGPAACGYTINGKGYGEYLGIQTNNYAEYKGVIEALKKVKALLGKDKAARAEVEVRADSELLVRQMNNEYKISNADLQTLYVEIHNLTLDFKRITFHHIPREQNSLADKMVNETIDSHI